MAEARAERAGDGIWGGVMGLQRFASRDAHCRNGPRMWLKARRENKTAIPRRIIMPCGDVYSAVQFTKRGMLFERTSTGQHAAFYAT